MKWYIKAIKNYVNFSGRTRFKGYWMFVLFNLIFTILALLLDRWIDLPLVGPFSELAELTSGAGYLSIFYTLFVLIPSISISVRRLHDSGKSGFWYLIIFIPLIGSIIYLFLMLAKTEPRDNRYGPGPKAFRQR